MSIQIVALIALALLPSPLPAKIKFKKPKPDPLAGYIERVQQQALDPTPINFGSLWNDNGRLVGVANDYKAARVGDVVGIVVAQDVTAQSAGNVATNRTFNASSGITALGGHIGTSGVQNLFTPNATQTLAGKSQAATTSTLRTQLAGRVEAVFPNGTMVVQAKREIVMNNEKQMVVLRGLVRPGDIAPDNTVASNRIGNLEFELNGKGVLSDGVRPPNVVIRFLLKLVGM
jgi:flagellar L-ring protein precursor FlgH